MTVEEKGREKETEINAINRNEQSRKKGKKNAKKENK